MTHDFTLKARHATNTEIFYALRDIGETLKIYRDAPADHPYVRKLYAEWDAYLDERRLRGERPGRRNRII